MCSFPVSTKNKKTKKKNYPYDISKNLSGFSSPVFHIWSGTGAKQKHTIKNASMWNKGCDDIRLEKYNMYHDTDPLIQYVS